MRSSFHAPLAGFSISREDLAAIIASLSNEEIEELSIEAARIEALALRLAVERGEVELDPPFLPPLFDYDGD